MLYRLEKLIGLSIGASDGTLGKIQDVYFDDHRWAVRYLVVETGDWLTGRKVLISPISVESIDWIQKVVRVRLNKQQVKGSPQIDTEMPVSRQHEVSLLDYYGFPDYWTGSLLWGATPYPVRPSYELVENRSPSTAPVPNDLYLRSLNEVKDYPLEATDAAIGTLEDFVVDNGSWALRYVVADTREWLIGKHLVIPTLWVRKLEWKARTFFVDMPHAMVMKAPEYDPTIALSREYETALFGHYERPGYWF